MTCLFVGIDIAKETFDLHLLGHASPKTSLTLPNTLAGFHALASLLPLAPGDQVRVGVESTSTYHLELAGFAQAQGWQVYLINPAWSAAFRRAAGPGHKTDALDAWSLAEMLRQRAHLLTPAPAEDPRWFQMRRLQRRRQELVKRVTKESNRLEATLEREVDLRGFIESSLAFLRAQITQIEQLIGQLLEQCEEAKKQVERLKQICGIGPVSARTITLELGDLSQYGQAKNLTAKVGLVPYQNESGQSRGRARLRAGGNSAVKGVLFMAALSALKSKAWEGWLEPQRQRKEGKKLIIAVMDKLLRLCYGVVKNDQDFDATLAFSS